MNGNYSNYLIEPYLAGDPIPSIIHGRCISVFTGLFIQCSAEGTMMGLLTERFKLDYKAPPPLLPHHHHNPLNESDHLVLFRLLLLLPICGSH